MGDLLGRGGMAEVFSGHALGDHGFQKPVAVKRLLPELASDHVFVERLIEEAKLLVGMQHGNIVSVLDLARDGDDVFLVMEFVDGPSVRQLLKLRGARGLSLGVATYIVQSAAAGLEFAHNRPGGAIIHADISPSNLLLTTSGEVRVADFGIARREGGGHGIVEGKWAYMAPEQARGEPLTPRSDVFALGVVLYELICGTHPFGSQVTHEQRDSVVMSVIPPRAVKPSIPAGLEAICMRALAHDPRARYKSMQQLIDALVEERFSSHFREAASDLARLIRKADPNPFAQKERTMVTERPVTLMTRSLLRDATPAPARHESRSEYASEYASRAEPRSEYASRAEPRSEYASRAESRSEYASRAPSRSEYSQREYSQREYSRSGFAPGTPAPAVDTTGSVAPILDSAARTNMVVVDELARAMLEVPPIFRADGTPLPQFKLPSGMPVPASAPAGRDLSAVVGGNTMTGHAGAPVASQAERSSRWTIGVLALATLVGIITAVAFHLKPSDDRPAPTAAVAPATTPTPGATPDPAPVPVVEERREVTPPAPAPPAPLPLAPPPGADPSTNAVASPPPAPPPPAPPVSGPARKPPEGGSSSGRTSAPLANPRAPKKEPGTLRVHTTPWAYVTVNGEKQTTPAAKFKLAPGRYTVRLNFPTLGISETHQVVVEPTKTFSLNINKEDE